MLRHQWAQTATLSELSVTFRTIRRTRICAQVVNGARAPALQKQTQGPGNFTSRETTHNPGSPASRQSRLDVARDPYFRWRPSHALSRNSRRGHSRRVVSDWL